MTRPRSLSKGLSMMSMKLFDISDLMAGKTPSQGNAKLNKRSEKVYLNIDSTRT